MARGTGLPAYDLAGRAAVITGAGRGIGFAIAQALVRRGCAVALVDLDGGAAAEAAGRLGRDRAIGLLADVTDPAAIRRAVAAAAERFGGVDLVIANAGIAPSPAPVRLMPPDEWERVIDVNLLGVYRTVHAGLEHVIARGGQVVVVSSVYAFMNGVMLSPYAVAKAGVEQLGRALRLELAPHGASATVAYFGFVDTEMVRQGFEQGRQLFGEDRGLLARTIISPERAGEAVAVAIERRRPRVIAPRWWAIASTLRGVLGPAGDHLARRSERVQEELRKAERAVGQTRGA